MATPDNQNQDSLGGFAAFRAAALSIAGIIALAGLIGLLLSSLIPAGPVQRVVENLMAVVFVIGVVQVVWEAWLHERLTGTFLAEVRSSAATMTSTINERFEELRSALDTDQRLFPSGVRSVEWSRTTWQAFLAQAPAVVLVPAELQTWLVNEWSAVVAIAETRALDAEVYLPNITGANERPHSVHLGQDATRLGEDLKSTIESLRSRWTDGTLTPGSKLRVYTYDRPAGYGLVVAAERWALILPQAAGPRPDQSPLVVCMEDGTDPSFLRWAQEQIPVLEPQLFDDWDA